MFRCSFCDFVHRNSIQGRRTQIFVLAPSSHNAANHKIIIIAPRRPRRRSLHVATSVIRCTSSTVTSHTGQPEKHAVDRHLRPPMRRRLTVVDDDGEGAMGDDDGDGATGDDDDGDGATGDDDDGDGATGDGETGYDDDDDDDGDGATGDDDDGDGATGDGATGYDDDDDGDGATGDDDDGGAATGDGATGYDDDSDGDWRRRQRRW